MDLVRCRKCFKEHSPIVDHECKSDPFLTGSATQTGPRLTIAGSCKECAHHDISSGTRRCAAYMDRALGYTYTPDATPTWCPELPAARLALARSVVAEAPCQVSLVRQIGCNLPCVRKGEHAEHRSACGRAWGGDTFVDHPDFDSRAFCDDGSEAQ